MYDTEELCGRLDKSRGYNMNTFSGYPVWPGDPRPEDIRTEDIARHLSRICRFNGAMKTKIVLRGLRCEWPIEIYSVAQHSALVCDHVEDPELKLPALLHDAAEYVLGDMVKPQKGLYSNRKDLESAWDKAIAARYGFDAALFDHPAIHEADYRMFLTEKRDLCTVKTTDFGTPSAKPYPEQVVPVLPTLAYKQFMEKFNAITGS